MSIKPVGAAPSLPPDVANNQPESLSRQIYARLREGIVRGRYPQGSRLAEQRLAVELGVSRVPLREAVPLLAVDGFVATLPRRGAVVTTWSIAAVNELFDLRLCLEVGAARYAARQVSAGARCDALAATLERSLVGLKSGDHYRIAEDSTTFHEMVVNLAANTLLKSSMRSVTGRMMWLFYLTSDLDEQDAYDGHRELLAAIESGNERFAESVAYAHIERDRSDSLAAMSAQMV